MLVDGSNRSNRLHRLKENVTKVVTEWSCFFISDIILGDV